MDLHVHEQSKAQIDYVFINKKWKNSAMNCEAYSSFGGVSSDHRIVTARLRLSLQKNATRTATIGTMTGPYLTTEILETNMLWDLEIDSRTYKRRQKNVPQMTNMRILLKHKVYSNKS